MARNTILFFANAYFFPYLDTVELLVHRIKAGTCPDNAHQMGDGFGYNVSFNSTDSEVIMTI